MKRPTLVIPASIEVPRARCLRLANGMKIYVLDDNDFEVTRVSFVFHAGSALQQRPFTAGSAANLLAEGSASLSGREIAERLDFLGSYYDASVDRDYVYLTFASLTRHLQRTLDIAKEILLSPVFPEKEVAAYREKRRQLLDIERQKVDTLAREEFARALFGEEHPYGVSYPASAYNDLTRGEIVDLYRRLYTAADGFAVCSGRVGDAELDAVAQLAGCIPAGNEPAAAHFPEVRTRREGFVLRSDAVQSSIRIGRLLFPRNHPDFVGMQVVASVLGGYFGSRLMRRLRERNGYTYGVMAAMVNFEHDGYLAVATQTGAAVTRQALDACYEEIERLRREPVGAEELALVRNILTGEMMRILDGPFGIADVTIENVLCGCDNSVVERNLERIRSITPEEILGLARRYLAREDLTTVVAGPAQP